MIVVRGYPEPVYFAGTAPTTSTLSNVTTLLLRPSQHEFSDDNTSFDALISSMLAKRWVEIRTPFTLIAAVKAVGSKSMSTWAGKPLGEHADLHADELRGSQTKSIDGDVDVSQGSGLVE